MTKKLYATPLMVKKYQTYYKETNNIDLYFPQALRKMYEEGLLSETQLSMPALSGVMSKEEFQQSYDEVPFEAIHILNNPSPQSNLSERTIFPENKDIFCLQHMNDIKSGGFFRNSYFSLTYIFKGYCDFYFENIGRITLTEGNMCIVAPGSKHFFSSYENSFAIDIIIRRSSFLILFNEFLTNDSIHADFFRKAMVKDNEKNYIIMQTDPDDLELTTYLQAIAAECYKDDPLSNICAVSLLKLFFANATRKYGHDAIMYNPLSERSDRDLNQILQYISNNYQHLTLSQLADHFHYNPSYISRMLHADSGKSFSEIITELRVTNACSYLDNTEKSIVDIAAMVGYNSPDHFSKSFKKEKGISPSEYRKNRASASALSEVHI